MSANAMTAASPTQFHVATEDHPPSGVMLGFWIYLMSDCFIFAMLFAMYAVLGGNYAAGPGPRDVFDLKLLAVNTTALLLSSITYGFAMIEISRNRKGATLFWLLITGLLGMLFVGVELHEFTDMIRDGAGPQRSAFLSSFFTLVGTHGTHVSFGILWLITLMVQVTRNGLTPTMKRRLACLSLFWHFLDIVWVGVFTFVYLMGVLR